MRRIADIKDAMSRGSEWKVIENGLPYTVRVVEKKTNCFLVEGPLEKPRRLWHVTRYEWPLMREVTQWFPNGFMMKRRGEKISFERVEGVEG